MKERLIKFIGENNLLAFNKYKSQISNSQNSIYKTRDAKAIHNKVLSKISQYFIFPDTSNLFNEFSFTRDENEILMRQEFFKKIKEIGKKDNSFLRELNLPRQNWKPKYDIVVVTENYETFNKLKQLGCPVQLIVSENDLSLLESKDLVQVIDCDEYGMALESLPQAIFFNNIEDIYLERYLEALSGWKNNIEILKNNQLSQNLLSITQKLSSLLPLIESKDSLKMDRDSIEKKVEEINFNVSERLKKLTIGGESLLAVLSKSVLPTELKQIVRQEIINSQIPSNVLIEEIPVKIFEEELEKVLSRQSFDEYSNIAEEIKRNSIQIKEIPKLIKELNEELIFFDFITGVSQFLEKEMEFVSFSECLEISISKNLFLENPKPISFQLNPLARCSILTGANSGGKTTLIEHIIQLISLQQIGLPAYGKISLPIFTDVYYFAKNKGSLNKGAFETLLTQMSEIKPGNKTLILADEIESVTEPGVAGKIICATAEYYLRQGCFLVIATHLGFEIQKTLPRGARIDGIEAKGLTAEFELIVDHNPVLGRLANSTPELIVEKMANTKSSPYFNFLNSSIKNR